ncbi:hypothetical protein N9924_01040 [bacterium]|nr:hypothetical protein [bacterium]
MSLARYDENYDYQDAMRDKFEDSCEPCFCLSCSEESKCYYTDDDRLSTCCTSDNFVLMDEVVFLVQDSRRHTARKDHTKEIKKGDLYRADYTRIVYNQDGSKVAEAWTIKTLIKKGE